MTAIPPSVSELVDVLTVMPGTVAVVLGGSRAVRFAEIAVERERLVEWVDRVADLLGVSKGESTPWKR